LPVRLATVQDSDGHVQQRRCQLGAEVACQCWPCAAVDEHVRPALGSASCCGAALCPQLRSGLVLPQIGQHLDVQKLKLPHRGDGLLDADVAVACAFRGGRQVLESWGDTPLPEGQADLRAAGIGRA
jgi:hypothetical protein